MPQFFKVSFSHSAVSDLEDIINFYRELKVHHVGERPVKKIFKAENIIIGLINFFSGIFFIFACIPLRKRKIKMNDWFGFRFSKAFESEQNWYDINEYGRAMMTKWGIFLLFTGFLAFFINFNNSVVAFLWAVIPITFCTIMPIVQTIKYSKRL